MKKINYWKDIPIHLDELVRKGYVKLPSLNHFNLSSFAQKIYEDMNGKTFQELGPTHEVFLRELDLAEHLTPKLFEIAQKFMNYKGEISNQYHIARCVKPGNSNELYRAHFDSHLFTLVLPLKIPTVLCDGSAGDLIYFPRARRMPKNEAINFVGKAFHKKYASKKGIERFAIKNEMLTNDFSDCCPLLFLGKTTLHTNKPVSIDCSSYRLTLLAHFFDSSPKYGVGGLMRFLRAR
jgi:hypothetical protein